MTYDNNKVCDPQKLHCKPLEQTIQKSGGGESAVRDRISCAWSEWRELANYLVSHSIQLEERAKDYCACVRPALLYAVKT